MVASLRAGLALFRLELVRLASRRRSWVLRGACALALLGVFAATYGGARRSVGAWPLGGGRMLLMGLTSLLYLAVVLLLPGMMSGVVVEERERRTLPLLLAAPLTPWTILLAKYASRLVPVLALLCLALPLFGMAHALGGLSVGDLLGTAWHLLLTALALGALGLWASCRSETARSAFLRAYAYSLVGYLVASFGLGFFLFWASARLFEIGMLGLAAGGLVLARRSFGKWGAAELPPTGWLGDVPGQPFRVRRSAGRPPPHDEPIAWWETHRPLVGGGTLVRVGLVLLLLLGGTIFFFGLSASDGAALASAGVCALWLLAIVVLASLGAGTFEAERRRHTLDLLLATPLTGREIVAQKAWGWRRAALLLAPLFLVLHLVHGLATDSSETGLYLVGSLLCLPIYLPLIGWFSLWVGLRMRAHAVTAAILGLLAWAAVPGLLAAGALAYLEGPGGAGALEALILLSPAALPVMLESGLRPGMGWLIPVNLAWHGAWWAFLRWRALRDADRLLGREGP